MGAKFTTESVAAYFESQGCKLLEQEYKDTSTPMSYQCVCGTVSAINFWNFRKGSRCKECFKKKETMSFDFVKSHFEQQGCELLETIYVHCETPMNFRCVCGNKAKMSWSNFRRGKRCQECRKKKISGSNNWHWQEDREAYKLKRLFATRCRAMLRASLKGLGKTDHTEILLGYTSDDLQKRIESHPNWANVKDGKWEIDHIFPINAFVHHGITDVKIINRLDNLQPLSSKANNNKKDKYDLVLFVEWLTSIGVDVPPGLSLQSS